MADEFCLKMPDFHVTLRDLLHDVNLRHGTDGFTSPPKEGVLMIFSPWKIQRLRSGLNPRTWVPKASTLPLDHRSRYNSYVTARSIFSRDFIFDSTSGWIYCQFKDVYWNFQAWRWFVQTIRPSKILQAITMIYHILNHLLYEVFPLSSV